MSSNFVIRPATADDVPTIFKFIMELAVYEKLAHEVYLMYFYFIL